MIRRIRKISGILPAYVWMILTFILPLLYIVIISFCKRGENWGIVYEFTLENYRKILDPLYLQIIGKSFVVAFLTTAVTLLIGYPFAYLLAGLPKKTQRILLVFLVVPFWTNAVIRIYGWYIILQGKGVINTALSAFGLPGFDMLYTDGAVELGTIYTLLPLMILPIYNAVEKIDRQLIEASRDLGADKFTVFRTVIWKLSLPGVISGCLMVFIPSIGFFYISDMMGGSNIVLLGNLIKTQFLEARNWPFGAALSVIMALLSLLFIALYRKLTHGSRIEVIL